MHRELAEVERAIAEAEEVMPLRQLRRVIRRIAVDDFDVRNFHPYRRQLAANVRRRQQLFRIEDEVVAGDRYTRHVGGVHQIGELDIQRCPAVPFTGTLRTEICCTCRRTRPSGVAASEPTISMGSGTTFFHVPRILTSSPSG